MEARFFICEHCGNLITFVENKGVPVSDWSAPFCISEINIKIPITVKEAGFV